VDEQQLRTLIAGGESARVEFKIKAPRPAELAERICGMANTRSGGVIIFGIADVSGEVIGLGRPNETIDLLLRATRMVKPAVSLLEGGPATYMLDGVTVVVAGIRRTTGRSTGRWRLLDAPRLAHDSTQRR
jgi:ATP-dependent DNA helicase RecG